jgi:exocyst complex component 2
MFAAAAAPGGAAAAASSSSSAAAAAEPAAPVSREELVDKQLLAVLSNVVHVSEAVAPALWAEFLALMPEATHEELEKSFAEAMALYDTLETLVIGQYLRRKALALSRLVRHGLVFSGRNWAALPEPREVRAYALELMLELTFIYSELLSTRKKELIRVLAALLEQLLASFSKALLEIDRLSPFGAVQILAEIDFIVECTRGLLSDHARALHAHLQFVLARCFRGADGDEQEAACQKLRQSLVAAATAKTRAMFYCFAAIRPASGPA